MMFSRKLYFLFLFVLNAPFLQGAPNQTSVPSNFSVRAHFGSGSIDPGDSAAAWDYTLRPDGKAMLKVFGFPGGATHATRSSFSLSPSDVAGICTVIDRENFFSLPNEMVGGAEDSPVYVLEIVAAGKHRKVHVQDPYDVRDKRHLRSFRRVWEAVFQRIPQPDGGDAVHHLRVNS